MESKLTDHGKATILLKLRSASKLSWCACSSISLVLFLLALGFGLTVHLVHWKFGYLNGNLQNYSTITGTINDELNYMMRHSCAKSPLAKKYQIAYITLKDGRKKHVLCDTTTAGGNWIIIQRRVAGDVNFSIASVSQVFRGGIGNHFTDFWKGAAWISQLCNQRNPCELRIDMQYKPKPYLSTIPQANDHKYHAHYNQFYLQSKYVYKDPCHLDPCIVDGMSCTSYYCDFKRWYLFVSNFSSSNPALDALSYLNNTTLTYFKSRNPCKMEGAWWYNNDCPSTSSNLNGKWGGTDGKGVIWSPLTGRNGTLPFVEMKIRLK